MPSSESGTELRKQEIGRPRVVPPLDRTGVAGMNHSLRHGVIEPLRMRHVVGIGAGDAREHVLIAFARQQIAVVERRLAEIGQQRVAAAVEAQIAGRRRLGQRLRRRGNAGAKARAPRVGEISTR